MLIGPLGSGKTTTVMKLAYNYKKNRKIGIICADTERFGAYDQLKQNSYSINIPFYGDRTSSNPITIVSDGLRHFSDRDLVIIDTAGIDDNIASLVKLTKFADILYHTLDNTSSAETIKMQIRNAARYNVHSYILTKADDGYNLGNLVAISPNTLQYVGHGERAKHLTRYNSGRIMSKIFGNNRNINNSRSLKKIAENTFKIMEGKSTLGDLHYNISQQIKMFQTNMGMLEYMGDAKEVMLNMYKKCLIYKYIMDSMTEKELSDPNYNKYFTEYSRVKRWSLGSGTSIKMVKELQTKYNDLSHGVSRCRRGKRGSNCSCQRCSFNKNIKKMYSKL